jgi:hypothetical protein
MIVIPPVRLDWGRRRQFGTGGQFAIGTATLRPVLACQRCPAFPPLPGFCLSPQFPILLTPLKKSL